MVQKEDIDCLVRRGELASYGIIAGSLEAWMVKALDLNIDYWDGSFDLPIVKNNKISLCTVVMDRLDQLKETIFKNIEYCNGYPNFEIILLNYNSRDGMDEWVKESLSDYISDGIITHYHTTEPEYFDNSHSRNVAFKLASGDLVTAIDADMFVGEDFLTYLNKIANQLPEKAVFIRGKTAIRGRIAFYKNEFMELGGFCEDFVGYNPWDRDIFHRAVVSGFKVAGFGRRYGKKAGGILPVEDHPNRNINYPDCVGGWNSAMKLNRALGAINILLGRIVANDRIHWGKAKLIKNFEEEVNI